MIPAHVRLSHYKRRDVQEAMVEAAKDREMAIKFNDKFGARPDILHNPGDILELAKQGATSFHVSEERWRNPLSLGPEMSRKDLEDLRTGWDLVIDVDCKVWEYSKLAAAFIVQTLKENGVTAISCKFSGNKGFHIGVPFEAFPGLVNNEETRKRFPDGVRIIASYLINEIDKNGRLAQVVLSNGLTPVIEKTGKSREELVKKSCVKCGQDLEKGKTACSRCGTMETKERLDVESLIEVDTLLISSRHLYRMVYSLHEKSGLVSVPVVPDKVLEFSKDSAKPENVVVEGKPFLDVSSTRSNDAGLLFDRAFQWHIELKGQQEYLARQEQGSRRYVEDETLQEAIPEDLFPPCIKLIQQGLQDGRKRALFIYMNFLSSTGHNYQQIERKVKEWNQKANPEPLREVFIKGQLHSLKTKQKMPPNCANDLYMKGIGVCQPDNFCQRIKNPAQYAKKKAWLIAQEQKKGKKKGSKKKTTEKGSLPQPAEEKGKGQRAPPENLREGNPQPL